MLHTVKEASEITGVKEGTLRAWISADKVDSEKIDGKRYITDESLDMILNTMVEEIPETEAAMAYLRRRREQLAKDADKLRNARQKREEKDEDGDFITPPGLENMLPVSIEEIMEERAKYRRWRSVAVVFEIAAVAISGAVLTHFSGTYDTIIIGLLAYIAFYIAVNDRP